MKEFKVLFPSDYFDKKSVDSEYQKEFNIVKALEINYIFFDYDEFLQSKNISISDSADGAEYLIYRGWMLNESDYSVLVELLYQKGYILLNNAETYSMCHYFKRVYEKISSCNVYVPKSLFLEYDSKENMWYNSPDLWDNNILKNNFGNYFMMKDNAKSVKGTNFPSKIYTDISYFDFKDLVEKFIQLRGGLFYGQIVLKKYENLKLYNGTTNEWRVFYFLNRVLTVSKNSNQSDDVNEVPQSLVEDENLTSIQSPFYTIDFAELEDGTWMIMEVGDGQVSGLCPNQNVLEFYSKIKNYWNEQ